MEVIKIGYRKPKKLIEVVLYTRKNGEVIELEGKGYKRQKCKVGENVVFPTATDNWDEICDCGFIYDGVTHMVSTNNNLFINKGSTLTINSPGL